MSNYNEKLQKLWHDFERENDRLPSSPREVVSWAVKQRMLVPPAMDPIARLAEDMARALREEYRTDSGGRRYRVNHAVRVTAGGVQSTLWAGIHWAPREHMERAFAQRRAQIVGDCAQLKTDVDVYNDKHRDEEPIQLVLDFAQDVAEIEAADLDAVG